MGHELARKPLSKAEALKTLAIDEEERVSRLKCRINEALPRYSGTPIRVDLPEGWTPKTVTAIREYYEAPELGWKVEHVTGSDQREARSWNYLTIG